eukprot:2452236-Pyramimonas_sp.AAC.1
MCRSDDSRQSCCHSRHSLGPRTAHERVLVLGYTYQLAANAVVGEGHALDALGAVGADAALLVVKAEELVHAHVAVRVGEACQGRIRSLRGRIRSLRGRIRSLRG